MGVSISQGEGTFHEINPTVVAANFVGGPTHELLVMHLDGTARFYDTGGKKLWRHTYATEAECKATEPLVADLDGDRVPETIFVVTCPNSAPSTLIVLGAEGGGSARLAMKLPFVTIASPLLADIDDDPEL